MQLSIEGELMNMKRQIKFKSNINIKAYNRPIKIAYLVPHENTDINNLIIDAVFYESYTRWAGLRTLVIPTNTDSFLDEKYENWLEHFDPDVIYTYVGLDKKFIEKINNYCCPIIIKEHEPRRSSNPPAMRDYLPDMELYYKPVSSITTLNSPYSGYKGFRGVTVGESKTILTLFGNVSENRFFADNFGLTFVL